ncbi:hypothetical protein [Thalassolituus oleivorans]|uniref:hypothetical protein n=1 Tax=Thalassolituus oleivorans TaxID=187493 RepID=UPI00240A95F9|nr:hypothetical protein [Thalassolituus oleivorans]MDF1639381.1 hypothetical protein [Thalassolituus oleivorans]
MRYGWMLLIVGCLSACTSVPVNQAVRYPTVRIDNALGESVSVFISDTMRTIDYAQGNLIPAGDSLGFRYVPSSSEQPKALDASIAAMKIMLRNGCSRYLNRYDLLREFTFDGIWAMTINSDTMNCN